jgi:hypothetical protein
LSVDTDLYTRAVGQFGAAGGQAVLLQQIGHMLVALLVRSLPGSSIGMVVYAIIRSAADWVCQSAMKCEPFRAAISSLPSSVPP